MDLPNLIANFFNVCSRTHSTMIINNVNEIMDLPNFIASLIDACSRYQTRVIIEGENHATNTIGRIILRFECNNCRHANVRCAMGRPYCVQCFGHPDCN